MAVREARIKGYAELCRILLEEEIPFRVVNYDEHIYIEEDEKCDITFDNVLRWLGNRPELKECHNPRAFMVVTADEVFVEVMRPQGDKTIDLRVTLLDDS